MMSIKNNTRMLVVAKSSAPLWWVEEDWMNEQQEQRLCPLPVTRTLPTPTHQVCDWDPDSINESNE